MLLLKFFAVCLFLTVSSRATAQDMDSVKHKLEAASATINNFPDTYYSKVDKKISALNNQLTKRSEKYLKKLEKQDTKIQRRLQKLDSIKSASALTETANKYKQLRQKISSKVPIEKITSNKYFPRLDSLTTSLKFLGKAGDLSSKASQPLKSLQLLQGKLQSSEKIKEYIAQRRQQIKDVLSKYTKLPAGLSKQYTKLNKTAYYYSAQLKEYKAMLKDPTKAESKALALLNKLPAFQKFMKKNSQLATLFKLPDDYGSIQNLAGMQTRQQVQGLLQQRLSSGGQNAQQVLQQNISLAKTQMNKLKDQLNKYGGNGGNADMPNFKPNTQKTKTFLQRLEYGANVQFAKSSGYFPSSADIGLSIGYKLNDKSTLGLGLCYKMGMGSINHIVISHQGLGFRSYGDYKLKKTFYISGGYEMNYNAQFKNIDQLKSLNAWQRSGLIGVSKKYKINSKVKGEMRLLYDFLANTHRPVSQPIVYRLGYNF